MNIRLQASTTIILARNNPVCPARKVSPSRIVWSESRGLTAYFPDFPGLPMTHDGPKTRVDPRMMITLGFEGKNVGRRRQEWAWATIPCTPHLTVTQPPHGPTRHPHNPIARPRAKQVPHAPLATSWDTLQHKYRALARTRARF